MPAIQALISSHRRDAENLVLATFDMLSRRIACLRPGMSRELKDVLDASHPALQYLLIGFEWIPTGNE